MRAALIHTWRLGSCLILAILFSSAVRAQSEGDAASAFSRGVQLQQQGKLNEAADQYRAALRAKPDYAEAQANLGVILAKLGKYDEAISAYEAAYRLAPQLTPVLLNLGIAYYRAGQYARAADVLRSFLERQQDSVQARQLYGLSLVEIGDDRNAIVQLELTLDQASSDVAVLYSLGLAYLHLGRPELKSMVERLASFPAGEGASHLLKGQSLIASGDHERAIAEFELAGKLDPNLPRLDYSLGLAYNQLGRSKEALAAFSRELTRRPDDFLTLYYVALLSEAQGSLEEARKHLDTALKLVPDSPDANALLGKLLFKQGKAAEAVKPLEYAVARNPADSDRRYLLARIYQQLGRREDAAREFAEVQKIRAKQLEQDRARTPKP